MGKNKIVQKIKEKPELSGLSEKLVISEIESYEKKNNLSITSLGKKDLKIAITSIRKGLRNLSGQFQKSIKSRTSLISGDLSKDKVLELLRTHSSTYERLSFYPILSKKFFDLNINSILDLGCGLNPIALSEYIFKNNSNKNLKYYASDIKEDELSLISKYFKKKKIKGETFFYDLRKFDSSQLPKVDICILFKVLDIIEKGTHKLATKIIKELNSRYILVSFATKKLSGKSMSHPKRKWFESLLLSNSLEYETFSAENEFFYLIKK